MSDDVHLTAVEARVLGCLLEKEITTPEYYPMSLNGVVTASNQRSNRDPVVEWEESVVEAGLDGLRRKRLAVMIHMAGSRVPKYKHALDAVYGSLDPAMTAVLTELLVRNGQSPGELRTRTERLDSAQDLTALEATLQRLANYGSGPLVAILAPGGGRRVRTVVHLLCGPVEETGALTLSAPQTVAIIPPPADWQAGVDAELADLKAEVAALRSLVDQLKILLD